MGKTLTEIAQQLKDANKKVQLIYAFNGTGKTRLSREFKQQVDPKQEGGDPCIDPSFFGVRVIAFGTTTTSTLRPPRQRSRPATRPGQVACPLAR